MYAHSSEPNFFRFDFQLMCEMCVQLPSPTAGYDLKGEVRIDAAMEAILSAANRTQRAAQRSDTIVTAVNEPRTAEEPHVRVTPIKLMPPSKAPQSSRQSSPPAAVSRQLISQMQVQVIDKTHSDVNSVGSEVKMSKVERSKAVHEPHFNQPAKQTAEPSNSLFSEASNDNQIVISHQVSTAESTEQRLPASPSSPLLQLSGQLKQSPSKYVPTMYYSASIMSTVGSPAWVTQHASSKPEFDERPIPADTRPLVQSPNEKTGIALTATNFMPNALSKHSAMDVNASNNTLPRAQTSYGPFLSPSAHASTLMSALVTTDEYYQQSVPPTVSGTFFT
jgi:hypothetical protein